MSPGLTDQQAASTARQVAAGDKEAYALLVNSYQDRVRALVAGYCVSPEQVEETCHLAFVDAYRNIAGFDPQRGSFLNWLLQIARNGLLGELRRRKSEGERAARYLERAARLQVDHLAMSTAQAALQTCLAELDEKEQQLVELRYNRRTNSDRIAATLGKTAGAVRMALQRIRERLRACVERRLSKAEA